MNKKFKNNSELWEFVSKILEEKNYTSHYEGKDKEIETYYIYEDKGPQHDYFNEICAGKILFNEISRTAIVTLFAHRDEKYILRVEPAYPEVMEDIFNTSFTKYLDELTEIFAEKSLEIKQKMLVDILEIKKTYKKDEEEFYEETF